MVQFSPPIIIDDRMEDKTSTLISVVKDPNVIVAGDSRAERQLVPNIIMRDNALKVINVASSSGDLVSFVAAIKKYHLDKKNRIFVLSVGISQVNDGATDDGYMSDKCFQRLSIMARLSIYKGNLWNLCLIQRRLSIKLLAKVLHLDRDLDLGGRNPPSENGYLGVHGVLKGELPATELNRLLISHSWYKNVALEGEKWKIFQKALSELGRMNGRFIIYQSPISPAWRLYTADSFVDRAEVKYSKMLGNEIRKYRNVSFIDFYSTVNANLTDEMFYDFQHLNTQGAKVFSEMLASKIREIGAAK